MDVISISNAPTIASHYTECTEAFSQLCASLRSPDVQFSDQMEEGEVQDEFGRLRVWAGNMCAYKTGEPSLDNRLRDAVHVRQQVVSLLEDLYNNLREAYMILSGQRLPYEEQQSDSDSSESSSSNDTMDSRTELQQIFLDLREIIDGLYDLSVTIRALASRGQIRVRDSTNLSEIEAQEIKHVDGEFPHLRQANASLLERLGRSNALRRETLRDLKARHGASAGQIEERADVLVDHWRRNDTSRDAGALQTSGLESSSHYSSDPSFNTQSSVTTLHQEVAEALSDDSHSITSSAASDDREVEGKLHIPQPPDDALSGESFKCIYCYKIIRGSGTLLWRSHVYRHLRPYICTSNECKTPFRTYATRHEWFEHEAQIHRRQWFCQACLLTFGDEVAFVKHQRAHHADTFANWQLPALNNLFSRPADRDVLDTCPLSSKPGELIRRHLAYHMRELALHVLPKGSMRDEFDIEHVPVRTPSIIPSKQNIHEAHQYEERVEQEEMSDHDSQAAEREATQATGEGKGFLVNETRLMSEGREQHPWDLVSKSLQKWEHQQALKSVALERARLAQLEDRERNQLDQARLAQLQEQKWTQRVKQLDERKQLEQARLAQLQKQKRKTMTKQLEESRHAQVELEQEIKQLVKNRLVEVGSQREQLEASRRESAAAAAAAVGTVVAATAIARPWLQRLMRAL